MCGQFSYQTLDQVNCVDRSEREEDERKRSFLLISRVNLLLPFPFTGNVQRRGEGEIETEKREGEKEFSYLLSNHEERENGGR